MMVLAPARWGCLGVDLGSGAFVRARFRGSSALVPFDVAAAPVGRDPYPDELRPPEAVVLAAAPRRMGRLTGRRAERYLRPLLHPRRRPLLGFTGPALPYWELAGDRPTVALFEADAGPELVDTPRGLRCRFGWQGCVHELPLDDSRPVAVAQGRAGRPRLLVALSAPHRGYCYKLVTALLPRP